jgi:hypothetical protein
MFEGHRPADEGHQRAPALPYGAMRPQGAALPADLAANGRGGLARAGWAILQESGDGLARFGAIQARLSRFR